MLRLLHVVDALPEGIAELEAEARSEGIGNVARLVADWTAGAERFTKPGELLLAAYDNDRLVGIGGLTVEPESRLTAMRLRRVFVRRAERRRGIGRALAEALIERALKHAALVTLNAGVQDAGLFWETLGFQRINAEHHTHELRRAS